jgi:hypothetical protein
MYITEIVDKLNKLIRKEWGKGPEGPIQITNHIALTSPTKDSSVTVVPENVDTYNLNRAENLVPRYTPNPPIPVSNTMINRFFIEPKDVERMLECNQYRNMTIANVIQSAKTEFGWQGALFDENRVLVLGFAEGAVVRELHQDPSHLEIRVYTYTKDKLK